MVRKIANKISKCIKSITGRSVKETAPEPYSI